MSIRNNSWKSSSHLRGFLVVSTALLIAGCSGGVSRLQDGFYTGATQGMPDRLPPVADNAPASAPIANPSPVQTSQNAQSAVPASGATATLGSGETISSLSRRYGVSADSIMRANGITDATRVRAGQKLTIPGATQIASQNNSATVAAPSSSSEPTQVASLQSTSASAGADTTSAAVKGGRMVAPTAAAAPDTKTAAPAAIAPVKTAVVQTASVQTEVANAGTAAAPERSGVAPLRWPARGRVITAFGAMDQSKKNEGIDIAVPEGTEIKSAENGVVVYAGDSMKEYGSTVVVRHDDGLVTVYGHASKLDVKRGDKVTRGQTIAKSGMTGTASTPKLHFEVRKDAAPVDPLSYLKG